MFKLTFENHKGWIETVIASSFTYESGVIVAVILYKTKKYYHPVSSIQVTTEVMK